MAGLNGSIEQLNNQLSVYLYATTLSLRRAEGLDFFRKPAMSPHVCLGASHDPPANTLSGEWVFKGCSKNQRWVVQAIAVVFFSMKKI